MRRQKKKKISTAASVLLLVVVLGAAVYLIGRLIYSGKVYNHCETEAGNIVVAADFMKDDTDAVFADGKDRLDTTVPGEYEIQIKVGWYTFTSTLRVKDSVAPEVETQKVILPVGSELNAEAFIKEIKDKTATTVAFLSEPELSAWGEQTVTLVVTDAAGNRTEARATLVFSPITDVLNVEAGGTYPTAEDFLARTEDGVVKVETIAFVQALPGMALSAVGEYPVILSVDGRNFESTVRVVDTVAPEVVTQKVEAYSTTQDLDPMAFAMSIQDATEVSAAFIEEPDFSKSGSQTVALRFTDAAGNVTETTATLELSQDTEAPVIVGAGDRSMIVGETISYKKGVTVTDNCDRAVELKIDSKVNTEAAGEYKVVYSAEDLAGNKTEVTVTFTVSENTYDLDEVNQMADAILDQIFTEDMTQKEQAEAIYKWIKNNIWYINHSDKINWVQGAYEGLSNRQGDCWVYACTAKVLLTRAGIENLDIKKIPAETSHYWNLINIGDGWWHFDTTPRVGGAQFFMVTDEWLMEYSEAHKKSHNYDKTQYPEMN